MSTKYKIAILLGYVWAMSIIPNALGFTGMINPDYNPTTPGINTEIGSINTTAGGTKFGFQGNSYNANYVGECSSMTCPCDPDEVTAQTCEHQDSVLECNGGGGTVRINDGNHGTSVICDSGVHSLGMINSSFCGDGICIDGEACLLDCGESGGNSGETFCPYYASSLKDCGESGGNSTSSTFLSITSITPDSASSGSSILINGTGFSAAGNIVSFSNRTTRGSTTQLQTQASKRPPRANDYNILSLTVPANLSGLYDVSVRNSTGEVSNTLVFLVPSSGTQTTNTDTANSNISPPPGTNFAITDLTPSQANASSNILVTGNRFTGSDNTFFLRNLQTGQTFTIRNASGSNPITSWLDAPEETNRLFSWLIPQAEAVEFIPGGASSGGISANTGGGGSIGIGPGGNDIIIICGGPGGTYETTGSLEENPCGGGEQIIDIIDRPFVEGYCGDGMCTPLLGESTQTCPVDCGGGTCIDTNWSPSAGNVCSGVSFLQTSNCSNTRTEIGTKTCAGSCTVSAWSPDASTICSGQSFVQCATTQGPFAHVWCQSQSFVQSSNCGTTRTVNGTKNCSSNTTLYSNAAFVIPSTAQPGTYEVTAQNGLGQVSNPLQFTIPGSATPPPSICTKTGGNVYGIAYGQDAGPLYFQPSDAANAHPALCIDFGVTINPDNSVSGTSLSPFYGTIDWHNSQVTSGSTYSVFTGSVALSNYSLNLGNTTSPDTDCVPANLSFPPKKEIICIDGTGKFSGWIKHPTTFGYINFDNVTTTWRPAGGAIAAGSCDFDPNDQTNKRNGVYVSWLLQCGHAFGTYLTGKGIYDNTTLALLNLSSPTEISTENSKIVTESSKLSENTVSTRGAGIAGIGNVIRSLTLGATALPSTTRQSTATFATEGTIVRLMREKIESYLCRAENSETARQQILTDFHISGNPFFIQNSKCLGGAGSQDLEAPAVNITPVDIGSSQITLKLHAVDNVAISDAAFDINTTASQSTPSSKHFNPNKNGVILAPGDALYWWAQDTAGNIGAGVAVAPGGSGGNSNRNINGTFPIGEVGNELPPERPGYERCLPTRTCYEIVCRDIAFCPDGPPPPQCDITYTCSQ